MHHAEPWAQPLKIFNIAPTFDGGDDWLQEPYIKGPEFFYHPQRPSYAVFFPNVKITNNGIMMFLLKIP